EGRRRSLTAAVPFAVIGEQEETLREGARFERDSSASRARSPHEDEAGRTARRFPNKSEGFRRHVRRSSAGRAVVRDAARVPAGGWSRSSALIAGRRLGVRSAAPNFEVVKVIHDKLLDMVGKVHDTRDVRNCVFSFRRVPIMLVGNKKDLHMERVISCEEGKALAESWNAAFMESSAKENQVPERQTAVEVFKRIILEAEKIDGGAPPGRTSCSLM
ncbi:hypothetical protein Z043_124087, partial [Scleropages formosus]